MASYYFRAPRAIPVAFSEQMRYPLIILNAPFAIAAATARVMKLVGQRHVASQIVGCIAHDDLAVKNPAPLAVAAKRRRIEKSPKHLIDSTEPPS